MNRTASFCAALALCFGLTGTAWADWSSWWRTPGQLQAGEFDELKRIAPDAHWQGIAEHELGNFTEAATAFDKAARGAMQEGNDEAANRSLYNRGVSEVHAGQYEQAVSTFDQVLDNDPDFQDAQHNKEIAQQLIQQQQQQQQQENSEGDSESSENDGEQEQSSDSQDQSSDSQGDSQDNAEQNAEQQAQQQQSRDESQEADPQQGRDGDADSQAESQSEQQQDAQDAQAALEAEAQAQAEEQELAEQNGDQNSSALAEPPLSEAEQATEQWLRRIPDDPTGLLRRKLEQSHRSEFPQVGDGRETW